MYLFGFSISKIHVDDKLVLIFAIPSYVLYTLYMSLLFISSLIFVELVDCV